jgi:hypothetical protein
MQELLNIKAAGRYIYYSALKGKCMDRSEVNNRFWRNLPSTKLQEFLDLIYCSVSEINVDISYVL